MVTLTSVMLPELLTVPLYRSTSSGSPAGHVLVTTIAGELLTGQVVVAVSRTVTPVQGVPPVAVTVLETEQQFKGTLYLPVKWAVALGASVARVRSGVAPLRLFTTTTLVRVTLPELLTVPL